MWSFFLIRGSASHQDCGNGKNLLENTVINVLEHLEELKGGESMAKFLLHGADSVGPTVRHNALPRPTKPRGVLPNLCTSQQPTKVPNRLYPRKLCHSPRPLQGNGFAAWRRSARMAVDCFISPMDLCRIGCGAWLLSNSENPELEAIVLRVDAAPCSKQPATLLLHSEPTNELKNVRELPCFGAKASPWNVE